MSRDLGTRLMTTIAYYVDNLVRVALIWIRNID